MARDRGRRGGTVVIAAVAVAATAAAFGVIGAGLYEVGQFVRSFDEGGREHLDEIPIARARACPHVAAIHAEAERFQSLYGGGLFPMYVAEPHADWTRVRAQLDDAMARLDLAIAAGQPSFPHRLRAELRAVRGDLAAGRLRLAAAPGPRELNASASGLFAHGQSHMGWAGDLVGHQCAVPLAV